MDVSRTPNRAAAASASRTKARPKARAGFGPGEGRSISSEVIDLNGAPDTNRTYDLPLRRGPLYPLSYRGASRDFNLSGDLN